MVTTGKVASNLECQMSSKLLVKTGKSLLSWFVLRAASASWPHRCNRIIRFKISGSQPGVFVLCLGTFGHVWRVHNLEDGEGVTSI